MNKKYSPNEGNNINDKLKELLHSAFDRTFLAQGLDAERRVKFTYDVHHGDGLFHCRVFVGPLAEGPPGHVHGGCLASILDQAMGAAVFMQGVFAMTAEMKINYLRPVPLHQEYFVTAWVERRDGRKLFTKTELSDAGNKILTKGEALFIEVNKEHLGTTDGRFIAQIKEVFPPKNREQ